MNGYDFSSAARTYVMYFMLHTNSLDKRSQHTIYRKPLSGKKLEIRRIICAGRAEQGMDLAAFGVFFTFRPLFS
jgi:hypothetical protein